MTPAAAWMTVSTYRYIISRSKQKTYLVAGEDQSISDHNILATASSKHNNLGDIITGQWLNTPA
jgi:hypothetical protein